MEGSIQKHTTDLQAIMTVKTESKEVYGGS